jgi:hypothetical protein
MTTPERHKFAWSEREDQYIASRRTEGATIEQLATECERTPNAISLRLIQLSATAPMPTTGQYGIMKLGRQLGRLRFFKPNDARSYIRSAIPVEHRAKFTVVQVLDQSSLQF